MNGSIFSLVLQEALDLDAKTQYTFKVQARVAATPAQYRLREASNLLIRVEHRSLR